MLVGYLYSLRVRIRVGFLTFGFFVVVGIEYAQLRWRGGRGAEEEEEEKKLKGEKRQPRSNETRTVIVGDEFCIPVSTT